MTIRQPFGISVFGSGLIRIIPDIATIRAAVSVLNEKPSDAFAEARQRVQSVTGFLGKRSGLEFGTSRVRLEAETRFSDGESHFVGYRAVVEINVQLRQLDNLEEVATGLVETGAIEIESIDFQTSKLKELRAEARRMAMAAAREKGTLYATVAGVHLGKVIHIEDVNPQVLQTFHQAHGHGDEPANLEVDADGGAAFLDPAAILVQAAVLVAFAIE